ncbi:MAG: DNA polymerase I [Dehalococcoidia bacterium]
MPRLVLLDGHGIIHRAYWAQKDNPLSVRKTGEIVTAVFGFANTLIKVLNELQPTHIAVTMDRAAPTFRHLKDETYKAHRPALPADLVSQFGRVQELIESFNIPIYSLDGFEADDVLATLARQAQVDSVETYLVTLDSDILQLVRPGVLVYMYRLYQRDTVTYDEAGVEAKYGLRPAQVPDLKSLQGDTSDNIPGVPGIGEKTAVKLLQKFGTLAGVYEHLLEVQPARIQELLRANEQQARHSRMMATIVDDVPVTLDLDACRAADYDPERVLNLFRELEFRSLIDRLPATNWFGRTAKPAPVEITDSEPTQAKAAVAYHIVDTNEALDDLVRRMQECTSFGFDTETTSLDVMRANLVGISIAMRPGESFYVPVGHSGTIVEPPKQLPLETILERLRPAFETPSIGKIAHNAKYDMAVLANAGIWVTNLVCDTMIAAYLLSERLLGLKQLAVDRLQEKMTPIEELIGKGAKQLSMADVAIDRVAPYAAADADMTLRLRVPLEADLRERELWSLFTEVEIPLVPVLTKMELTGVAIDVAVLREQSQTIGIEMERVEGEIFAAVGHQFNLNSPKQLSSILFEELHLPKTRKTTQGFSTDAQSLEALRKVHPAVDLLLEYRQLAKLKSTYLDALPALINPRTGRVHTSFNQCAAATGRLSSSDPNLQNIPVRTEMGRDVRRAFVARLDDLPAKLLSVDYSQIELRILAHITQEPRLVEAFRADEDIHKATGADLFGVPIDEVTPDMRRLAKTINFATIYGLSAQGLSQRTEFSNREAADFIKKYFERYPGIQRYLKETIEQTRQFGYAETLLKRRRYIREISSSNFNLRSQAERMATNHPIQGTNADIIKIAMNRIQAELEQRQLRSRMILQVHDELIFECPDAELDQIARLACEIMPRSIELSVPIKVDLKVGLNWGDMEPLAVSDAAVGTVPTGARQADR